jgi:hypothetical protein
VFPPGVDELSDKDNLLRLLRPAAAYILHGVLLLWGQSPLQQSLEEGAALTARTQVGKLRLAE